LNDHSSKQKETRRALRLLINTPAAGSLLAPYISRGLRVPGILERISFATQRYSMKVRAKGTRNKIKYKRKTQEETFY